MQEGLSRQGLGREPKKGRELSGVLPYIPYGPGEREDPLSLSKKLPDKKQSVTRRRDQAVMAETQNYAFL